MHDLQLGLHYTLWRIEDTTEIVFRRKKRRFSRRKRSKQQGK